MSRAWVVVAVVLVAGQAAGWAAPDERPVRVFATVEHWAFAFGHGAFAKPDKASEPKGDVVCPLGDVDGDGAADLLLRALAGKKARFKALAGPDFHKVLWTVDKEATAVLACGADLQGDGASDPIVEEPTAPSAVEPLPGVPLALTPEAAPTMLEALDGASGEALVTVAADEGGPAAATSAGGGGSTTDAELTPAAPDVLVHAETRSDGADLTLPAGGAAVDAGDSTVTLQVLDASGEVQGEIAPASPRDEILAYAPVPSDDGARIVVVASTEASPSDAAPVGTTTTTSYTTQGEVVWTHEDPPSDDVVVLVPQAGDVDGDGVTDVIVEHVPPSMAVDASSSVAVLSGEDGSVLLDVGAASGVLVALPLGDVAPRDGAAADAVLVVAQASPGSPLSLTCVGGDGATCWDAELPADAVPVAAGTDAFTGDATGFEDLTGDGVPDVATVGTVDGTATLVVLDGATGDVAWSAPVPATSTVDTVPDGAGVDLVVVDPAEGDVDVERLDGATGKVEWASKGRNGGHGGSRARVDVVPLGPDTTSLVVAVVGESGPGAPAAEGPDEVYVVDGATGRSVWTTSTDATVEAPAALEVVGAGGGTAATPGPGVAAVALLAFAAWAHRRR